LANLEILTITLSNWNRKMIRDVNVLHLENVNGAADGPIHMKFGDAK